RLTPQHQPDDPVLASPSEHRVQPAAASMLLETPAPRHNPPVTVRPRQVPPHDALSPSPVPPSAAGNLRHPDTMPRDPGSPPDAAAAPPLEITADLQQQLELMGARHLVVERLGDSGLYRCICLADVPGTTYQ